MSTCAVAIQVGTAFGANLGSLRRLVPICSVRPVGRSSTTGRATTSTRSPPVPLTNAALNLTSETKLFPVPCRFIIDCRHWRAHLPQTIEAFFFRAPFFTPEETKRMVEHMRDVNERFLSRFGLSSSAYPLLRFDPSQREPGPFSLA